MERVVERDHGRPSRRLAGDLHRVLHSLSPGVREHRPLVELPGRQRVQPLGELDVGLVRRHVEARVRVELQLLLRRRHHLGRRVADVQDRDARGEVDQPVAVDVLDDRARGPGRDDGMDVEHGLGDGGLPALEPLAGLRTGDLGEDLSLLRDVHRASFRPRLSVKCATPGGSAARPGPRKLLRTWVGSRRRGHPVRRSPRHRWPAVPRRAS